MYLFRKYFCSIKTYFNSKPYLKFIPNLMNDQEKEPEVVSNPEVKQDVEATDAIHSTEEALTETPLESVSKKEYEELYQKYIRLYSDFENYKKRALKERSELLQTATTEVFKTILPVLDDFERAMKATETATEVEKIKEGLQLIQTKFMNTLGQRGLKPMPALGEVFNPDLHEAIANVPTDNEEQKGKILDEIEKGYFLNDKVIRYAKVVVNN
jgi:molecular chaperone GrpE